MIDMKCPFRQGYEKPLHYPCTLLIKLKPGCSYDKRLYCDIFSLYYKREKEWDMGDLTDKIEWWCYATDFERYIKQLQKDLEVTRKAYNVANEKLRHCVNITVEELEKLQGNLLITYNALLYFSKDPIAQNALKKITMPEQGGGNE